MSELADRFAKAIHRKGKIMVAISPEERDHIVGVLRQITEKSNLIPWQSMFKMAHEHLATTLPPGTRYELRMTGHPPFTELTFRADGEMNQIEPWSNTPEQTETHYRVGRYTVPEKT